MNLIIIDSRISMNIIKKYLVFVVCICMTGFILGAVQTSYSEIKPVYPVPTSQQLAWQKMEYIAFVHFGMNTFTGKEWGDGTEDPSLFNPTEFNAKQWVKAVKDAGMKMIILTAKHHDGFCLWPSKYTEHSVKNSPWRNGKGDIVKEVADACREGGIQFGFYLSPWDRHESSYGNSPVYNEYFKNQLRELLTNYGEICEVWFDGACGEGPNGKRQEYDFAGYYSVIRELQPNAVIAIMGPDVRWVGNESGVARETEWSVQAVPSENLSEPRFKFNPTLVQGSLNYLTDQTEIERQTGSLVWYPAECDVSIRPGWFYHASQDDKVKSLVHLLDIYFKSIGRNSVLLLNLPPDQRGLIHENDVQRLRELRQAVDKMFEHDYTEGASASASNVCDNDARYAANNVLDHDPSTFWTTDEDITEASFNIDLDSIQTFNVAMLQENISLGQRVAEFKLEIQQEDEWKEIAKGTTIGYKRLLRLPTVSTDTIRLTITKSRGCPIIHTFSLYKK